MIIVPNGLLWTFICRQTYLETWCYRVPKLSNFFVVFGAQSWLWIQFPDHLYCFTPWNSAFYQPWYFVQYAKKLRKKVSFRDVTEILHLEWNILEDVMIPDHRKVAGLFFCFLHGFWDLISICSCPELCISQLQIPCGVWLTDATAKGGGIPDGFYNASGGIGIGTDTRS